MYVPVFRSLRKLNTNNNIHKQKRYLFSVSKIPFMDSDSFEFALIAGPFFTAVNALAGVLLSFVGEVRPVRVSSATK